MVFINFDKKNCVNVGSYNVTLKFPEGININYPLSSRVFNTPAMVAPPDLSALMTF